MVQASDLPAPPMQPATQTPSRYALEELLGEGGMARVYRARELASGRVVALKQMFSAGRENERERLAHALFEREYQTLVQLRHPRVIEVYDFGFGQDQCPYYTMELLDGGDLRERAPLPWREACSLIFDVCSSLALLHSRGLLHRDISPRNVRCTSEGRAKLIDFGAMAPMTAGGADVVGTPAFTAPETVHRLALDARADLYSVGVTLYYALTGRLPYPARTFGELAGAWQSGKVTPPSMLRPEVNAALDDLVLALIHLHPDLRPRTASDVMQRLAAIAGLAFGESEAVSRAYLATPTLVGRDDALRDLRDRLLSARKGRCESVMVSGAARAGRSRLLDVCALDAKTLGFTVLRAGARSSERFAAAHALAGDLLALVPGLEGAAHAPELFAPLPCNDNSGATAGQQFALRPLSELALTPDQVQHGLCDLFQRASQRAPLLLAVDDVDRMDQPSAAVLAALLDDAARGALCVVLSADAGELQGGVAGALARRCVALPIRALTLAENRSLFESLFGTAAHLETIADEIHGVSGGSPGKALDAAQHLVDRGIVRYEAGAWVLPSQLSASDLPRDTREGVRARVTALSATARHVAELQALAFYGNFTDADYHALALGVPGADVEQALSELTTKRVIIRTGPNYQLDNRLLQAVLAEELDSAALVMCHAALADFYEPRSAIALIYHAFAAGHDERGLDALIRFQDELRQKPDTRALLTLHLGKMVPCYDQALCTALSLGRSQRQINDLRRWMMSTTIAIENGLYNESARAWLEQLVHDSGLDLYRNAEGSVPADQRLMSALQGAKQRHLELPEERRVYGVEEAIRLLPEYVVFAIALGARSQDCALLQTLPGLLEPFRVLSPLIDAIWKNAVATYAQLSCQLERAVELWGEALSTLDAMSGSDTRLTAAIANAIALALGNTEAQLGLPDAVRWADRLDGDPYQCISALQLRRILRLEHGDWKGAEQLRRQGEVLALQRQSPQMFYTLLIGEVAVCSQIGDLHGLQKTIERIRAVSEVHAGWRFNLIGAEAHLDFARGDYLAALPKFERCCALCAFDADGFSPNPGVWLSSQAGLAQTLLALDRNEPARATAAAALQVCGQRGIEGAAWELVCVFALAEAKLGHTQAAPRLDAFIAQQVARGVGGLRLGLCYETRARIAITTHDADGFKHYAACCAHEYRHGTGSFVAARYERLVNEAARQGMHGLTLAETMAAEGGDASHLQLLVSRTMGRTQRADARAMAAVELVCEAFSAPTGHLFLRRGEDVGLVASHGVSGSAPDQLLELVRSHWAAERAHAESLLTEMVTGAADDDDALFATASCEVHGVCYQLTLLRGSSAGAPQVAGIVALELATAPELNAVQVQLIQLVAAHLLDARDATTDESIEP